MRRPFLAVISTRAGQLTLVLWIAATLAASVRPVLRHEHNFDIFRTASTHLAAAQDMYAESRPGMDRFKYTPGFAFLFAPFAILPFALGVLVWNALNAATLYWAIGRLLPSPRATLARGIVLVEMFGSLQNAQSNALIAGLIVLTFTELERGHDAGAAAALSLGTFVKLFPIAAVTFALLRATRIRFVVWCLVAGLIILVAPLVVVRPAWLLQQYGAWLAVVRHDSGDPGFSVMQHMRLWFGVSWAAWPQQLAGTLILLAPLVVRGGASVQREWKLRFLASLLLFCVLFNHQSESPSFVIALTGVAVWFSVDDPSSWRWLVLGFVFLCTVLVNSSAMPPAARSYLFAVRAKTVPVLIVWLILQVELWRRGGRPRQRSSSPGERTTLDAAVA
ncbi:MAG TPA: glycosyltransferase family 87 protein [Gemmatimonadaceae bacterium]|nr:glycosyltransferase family 87 protein [Gemmatimonadaceae bacterium]